MTFVSVKNRKKEKLRWLRGTGVLKRVFGGKASKPAVLEMLGAVLLSVDGYVMQRI